LRRDIYGNEEDETGVGEEKSVFLFGGALAKRGATQSLYIYNIFYVPVPIYMYP